MKLKLFFLPLLLALLGNLSADAAVRYAGGDISLLPEYDNSIYYDPSGKRVADFLTYTAEQGMNCMRVRLFVTPSNYKGSDKDANAKQDIDYIIPICKRIKDAGMALMLDFHYSDTWADPAKQWTPADWVSLSDSELYTKIYDYTKESLQTLAANGIVPDLIQTGNEISYGMLWGAYNASSSSLKKVHANNDSNWSRFKSLLTNAVKACREVCPKAKIVIHTERVPQPWYIQSFYERLSDLDYDIIGMSYYPYYHGNMDQLEAAISAAETSFPTKEIMVVETGYSYKWSVDNPVSQDYPLSQTGQNEFSTDLVNMLLKHKAVTGIFWWWMEYNAYGASLSNWYNYALVDSQNGKISPALATIASFAGENDFVPGGDDPVVDPDLPGDYPDIYFLYNDNGDWQLPGAKMIFSEGGIYTLKNVSISKDDGDGWFSMTSVYTTGDWTAVNANRFGPAVNDTQVTTGEVYEVAEIANSWQIAAGVYNVVFDYDKMQLTVTKYVEGEDDVELGVDVVGEDDAPAVWYDLAGRRVIKPSSPGIYIRNGKKIIIRQ